MNIFQTLFPRITSFLGRNGSGQCKGIDVYRNGHEIWLQPINSRGEVSRCRLEIPLECVHDLIGKIQACASTGPSVLQYASPSKVVQPVINIKVIANMCDNVSYLTIREGKISYASAGGVPLAISNMWPQEMEVRFALEKCTTGEQALLACRRFQHYAKSFEVL